MNAAEFDRQRLWHYRAKPWRVVDGDTFVALIDHGHRNAGLIPIRLAGYSADERWQADGPRATAALRSALAPYWNDDPTDWTLRIVTLQRETVVSEVQSYERWVSEVYLANGGDDLEEIIKVLAA